MGGGGGHGKVKSDINVTPLVDVVLVLLIIFIVTIPVMLRELALDIPKKDPDQENVPDSPPIIVTLKANGSIMLQTGYAGSEEIQRADLADKLHDRLAHLADKDKVVFVDFEDDPDHPDANFVRYGDAVSVIDTVKGADHDAMVGLKMKDKGTPGGQPTPSGGE
jgi:biopolymer transport protein ExbD